MFQYGNVRMVIKFMITRNVVGLFEIIAASVKKPFIIFQYSPQITYIPCQYKIFS